jgi:hypothetical protein
MKKMRISSKIDETSASFNFIAFGNENAVVKSTFCAVASVHSAAISIADYIAAS